MRFCAKALLVATLALTAGPPAAAQSWAGRGRLQGNVTDEAGKPVDGAKVTLRKGTERVDPAAPGPDSLVTDKRGKWSILGLGGGTWGILIEKESFMLSEGQVRVNEFGPAQPINVTLKVIPKEIIEQAERESETGQAKIAIEKGNLLLTEEKYAEARSEYEQALAKLDVQFHPPILRAIANTHFKQEQTDQAVAALQKALEITPDEPGTLQLLVTLLVAAGREAEAQTYIAKLPSGTTLDPNTLLNLGIKAFNEQRFDEAMARFNRVVAENPAMPEAYYYRGLVYLNQSKNAEAKADFQKLIELDPNHSLAAEARDFLKSL
jgi:tetratricopeptide (TPR) repeat protein